MVESINHRQGVSLVGRRSVKEGADHMQKVYARLACIVAICQIAGAICIFLYPQQYIFGGPDVVRDALRVFTIVEEIWFVISIYGVFAPNTPVEQKNSAKAYLIYSIVRIVMMVCWCKLLFASPPTLWWIAGIPGVLFGIFYLSLNLRQVEHYALTE